MYVILPNYFGARYSANSVKTTPRLRLSHSKKKSISFEINIDLCCTFARHEEDEKNDGKHAGVHNYGHNGFINNKRNSGTEHRKKDRYKDRLIYRKETIRLKREKRATKFHL